MNKIFTLLLSAAFCTASPVFAMDPPENPERQGFTPKKIILQTIQYQNEFYCTEHTFPSIQEFLGGDGEKIIIKVKNIEDFATENISRGIASHTLPFDLTIGQNFTLTQKGITDLTQMIEHPQLKTLAMHFSNAFIRSSALFESLKVCSHTEQLAIGTLSGSFPSIMSPQETQQLSKKFPFLKGLKLLANCEDIKFLRPLPQLTSLKLRAWADKDLHPLGSLIHLSQLDLGWCYLTGADFTALSSLSNLHTLDLTFNWLKKDSIPSINCPSLTDLNLSENHLGNEGALILATHCVNMSNLTKLNLSNNPGICNDGILALVNLSQLKDLRIHNNLMNDEGGKLLAEALGTWFDAESFHAQAIETPVRKINVSRNKMTQTSRDFLNETLSSSRGNSIGSSMGSLDLQW